jgi:hypothetical protein
MDGSAPAEQVVRLLDLASGKTVLTLPAGNTQVASLAFSPDGSLLAAGGYDRTVRLWDARTGRAFPELRGHHNAVHGLSFSPDGRSLATACEGGKIVLWEVSTRQPRRTWSGHGGGVWSLAFAPDGRTLATGSFDTTALIWDLARLPSSGAPVPETADSLWALLAEQSAERAYDAMGALAASPTAVDMIKVRLRAEPFDAVRVNRLVVELGSDDFKARQKATEALGKLGDAAAPALRQALAGNPTLELRRRAERLLADVQERPPSPQRLRIMRAVEVLERLRTPEARQALEGLTKSAADPRVPAEAEPALRRLTGKRPAVP